MTLRFFEEKVTQCCIYLEILYEQFFLHCYFACLNPIKKKVSRKNCLWFFFFLGLVIKEVGILNPNWQSD